MRQTRHTRQSIKRAHQREAAELLPRFLAKVGRSTMTDTARKLGIPRDALQNWTSGGQLPTAWLPKVREWVGE